MDGASIFIADHYRAVADMIVKWALGESKHCNVEVAEWFPSLVDRQRLFKLLDSGKPKLLEVGRLQKNRDLAKLPVKSTQLLDSGFIQLPDRL
ncbi:hypothetical protein V5O39_03980 [Pseudomonas parakoreensis]